MHTLKAFTAMAHILMELQDPLGVLSAQPMWGGFYMPQNTLIQSEVTRTSETNLQI